MTDRLLSHRFLYFQRQTAKAHRLAADSLARFCPAQQTHRRK
jgi:hypothetical protein